MDPWPGFQRSPNLHTDSESDALVIANSESEIERDEAQQQLQQQQQQQPKGRQPESRKRLATALKKDAVPANGSQEGETIEAIQRELSRPLEAVIADKTAAVMVTTTNLSDSETTVFPEAITRPSLEPSESIDLGMSSLDNLYSYAEIPNNWSEFLGLFVILK